MKGSVPYRGCSAAHQMGPGGRLTSGASRPGASRPPVRTTTVPEMSAAGPSSSLSRNRAHVPEKTEPPESGGNKVG